MESKFLKGLTVTVCLFFLAVSGVMAQEPCTADFNCDHNVDGYDVGVFIGQFGRSQYFDPCPDCYDSPCPCTTQGCDPPAPVQKTGQTDCWDENGDPILCQTCYIGQGCTNKTGQDGMWESGVALPEPRFTDNADGTITDNLTGLIWLKNADCFGSRTWQNALDDCNNLSAGYCGLTDASVAGDWKLPNRRELFSLIHDDYVFPSLTNTAGTGIGTEGDPFINIRDISWSSTTHRYQPTKASAVAIVNGTMFEPLKTNLHYAWCVRSGQ